MGTSDRHYFAWLQGALERFEESSRVLAGIRLQENHPVFWVLAGAGPDPATAFVSDALGPAATTRFLDRFAAGTGVIRADFNALGNLPAAACDVLMMTRASYMVEGPRAFLAGARRLLRPGGVMIVDWVHGSADAPVLDLPGAHEYEGERYRFQTTYADAAFVAEFPAEFAAFIRHVNRPPAIGAALKRLAGGGAARDITPATYLDALRTDLERAGGHLVGPEVMEEFFKVAFRDARYFHRLTEKFYLHLLTVLRPVGA